MDVNSEWVPAPPATLATVTSCAKRYEGVVYGDTATKVDVEFPHALAAAQFYDQYSDDWAIELRDPIDHLENTVVLIVAKS